MAKTRTKSMEGSWFRFPFTHALGAGTRFRILIHHGKLVLRCCSHNKSREESGLKAEPMVKDLFLASKLASFHTAKISRTYFI
jgi:hypothetical protein